MTEHKSCSKALQMHSIRGTARLTSPLCDWSQNKMPVTPKNKTKTSLTSPLLVSQVFALVFAFVSMAHAISRLVF